MKPDGLRKLLEMAESPDRDKMGTAMSEVTFYLGPLLAELWEASKRYRAVDSRVDSEWLTTRENLDKALTALEEA